MLDLDGIVYRWADTSRYIITSQFPEITLGESTHWDYIKDELHKQGRDEVWKWLWTEGITKHGMFRYGSLYKGSREALRRMDESGKVENIVVTSRPATAILDTEDWISYQRLPHVAMHIIPVGTNKSRYVNSEHLDIIIEDGAHNVEDVLDRTSARTMLWDRLWNQHFTSKSPRFVRVSSWSEVEQEIYALWEKINGRIEGDKP